VILFDMTRLPVGGSVVQVSDVHNVAVRVVLNRRWNLYLQSFEETDNLGAAYDGQALPLQAFWPVPVPN
jgi:hypothetical protein